jgi:hypothetical protein
MLMVESAFRTVAFRLLTPCSPPLCPLDLHLDSAGTLTSTGHIISTEEPTFCSDILCKLV